MGLETYLVASVAAFLVSLICSTAGVTGAFLLVPFQMSVLGLQSPAVSATNHLYNVVAAPGGFSSYRKQRLMLWPAVFVLLAGTVPGILLGIALRIRYLPDPATFRPFAGSVLTLLGLLLLVRSWAREWKATHDSELPTNLSVIESSWRSVRYRFGTETHSFAVPQLFLFALLVGVVGGAYGVGGGVFTSAYLIGVCGLPVYTTAGATLLSTFSASCVGAAGFAIVAWYGGGTEIPVSPVWSLGLAMGVGGLCGGFLGARLQRFLPSALIGTVMAVFLLLLGATYVFRLR